MPTLTTPLLPTTTTTRSPTPKTPLDPAAPLLLTRTLQSSFISQLPFRSASTRLVQQWLSNWFGHHVDCPILDPAHAKALQKVTWNGKVVRIWEREMLFTDLVGWGFEEGDAAALVEDIVEARGYWNRICRIIKLHAGQWVAYNLFFLVTLIWQGWGSVELTFRSVSCWIFDAFMLWLDLTLGIILLHLVCEFLMSYIRRWRFWSVQERHIKELGV